MFIAPESGEAPEEKWETAFCCTGKEGSDGSEGSEGSEGCEQGFTSDLLMVDPDADISRYENSLRL